MCKCSAIMYRRGRATKYWVNLIFKKSGLPQGIFRHFRLYQQFRGNAENHHFLVFLVPAPRRKKISGNCLVCLKDNCPGFQKTPLEIMPGVSLPIFFMPKLKSFGVAPTSPTFQDHGFPRSHVRYTFQDPGFPRSHANNKFQDPELPRSYNLESPKSYKYTFQDPESPRSHDK